MAGAICAMAIFVTVAVRMERTSIDPFVMSSLAFESEPWRLVSSTLPHGDWIHLLFNVIWIWVLGTKLEEVLGHVTTFAIVVILAVGSGAAQYAFAVGGIGLSGVGYGLVGCLWILSKRDSRFRDAIDRNVIITFLAWGLLCVALTYSGVWNIGNIAHGSGFVLGAIIGWVIAPGPIARRVGAGLGLAVLVGALVAASALFRADINLSGEGAALEDANLGVEALFAKDYEAAERYLQRALALDPRNAGAWHNYGIALHHLGREQEAATAWSRAQELDPSLGSK